MSLISLLQVKQVRGLNIDRSQLAFFVELMFTALLRHHPQLQSIPPLQFLVEDPIMHKALAETRSNQEI